MKSDTYGSRNSWLVRVVFGISDPSLLRAALALCLVVVIAWARAPYTQISDALFVSDGFGYYIYLPSIVIDHDLDLSNQVTRIPYEGKKQFYRVSEATGRHTNQFPVGSALFWSPFFLAADVSVVLLKGLGVPLDRSGFGYWYELPVYLGSAAFGLAAVFLISRSLRMMFPASITAASLFGVAFATPLAYYCLVEPNMSHTVAMFTVSFWIWRLQLAFHRRESGGSAWITLGILLGLVALVRPYNGLLGLVAIPVAWAVGQESAAGSSQLAELVKATVRLLVCCLSALAVVSLQVVVWKTLYGDWFVIPKGSGYERMRWLSPTMGSYLASVFLFSPLYGLGLLGLFLGAQWKWPATAGGKSHDVSTGAVDDHVLNVSFAQLVAPWMIVVLIVISLVIAASRDWLLGTSFGQRRMVDWSIFFAFGMALLLSMLQRRWAINRLVQWCVFCLAFVQSGLIVVYLLQPGRLPEYGRVF